MKICVIGPDFGPFRGERSRAPTHLQRNASRFETARHCSLQACWCRQANEAVSLHCERSAEVFNDVVKVHSKHLACISRAAMANRPTPDSLDSRSVAPPAAPFFGIASKNFFDPSPVKRLDIASAEIARASMTESLPYASSELRKARRLTLFYRHKSRIVDSFAQRWIAWRCGERVRRSHIALRRLRCSQRRARVHVSLSGVAVSCILV
jgi:hypothetical protein